MADRGEYFGNLALKNFQEIADPEYFLWFPLASGWYIVFVVIAVYLTWLGHRAFRNHIENAYRREALRLLDLVNADHDYGQRNSRQYLQRLRHLLKATALKVYPRGEIAGLTGGPWLSFLNNSVAEPAFDMSVQALLDASVYDRDYQPDPTSLVSFASAVSYWLRLHRNPHIESAGVKNTGVKSTGIEATVVVTKSAVVQ